MSKKWILGMALLGMCGVAMAGEQTAEAERNPAAVSSPTFVAASEMTPTTLESIFTQALFKTSRLESGDLSVQFGAGGGRATVHIDQAHQLLRYYRVYRFKTSATDTQKLELANRINREIIMVRAYIPKGQADTLVLDYFQSYDEGVTRYQIASTARYSMDVAMKAVNQMDEADIVK